MKLIVIITLVLLALLVIGGAFVAGMIIGTGRAPTTTDTLSAREKKILAELVEAASTSRRESDRALADAGFDIQGASSTELDRLRNHLR